MHKTDYSIKNPIVVETDNKPKALSAKKILLTQLLK